jgi:predicted deacylase
VTSEQWEQLKAEYGAVDPAKAGVYLSDAILDLHARVESLTVEINRLNRVVERHLQHESELKAKKAFGEKR